MYSCIRDYGICLDYIYILIKFNLDIFCVILDFYYLDYKFIIVYLFM